MGEPGLRGPTDVFAERLSGFAVVLCRAEEGGNVGSACRAMKTMGLSRLILVGGPEYPRDRVRTMAVHAYDLFESACSFPDLASALAGFSLSAGFTRRRGERRKAFSLSVEDFAAMALKRPMAPGSDEGNGAVALVFGNERTGLTEGELGLCSLAVHIPSSEAFPSINLAQAVQIACYELRRQAIGEKDGSAAPVARSEVEAAVARIADHLRGIGFFKVTRDRDLAAFLRDSAERAAYTAKELRYFESIFRKAAGMLHSSQASRGMLRGRLGREAGSTD